MVPGRSANHRVPAGHDEQITNRAPGKLELQGLHGDAFTFHVGGILVSIGHNYWLTRRLEDGASIGELSGVIALVGVGQIGMKLVFLSVASVAIFIGRTARPVSSHAA